MMVAKTLFGGARSWKMHLRRTSGIIKLLPTAQCYCDHCHPLIRPSQAQAGLRA